MSLKDKYKTDATAARDGVWFDFTALPNNDGSVPGFKLARMTKQNKKYSAALRKVTNGVDIDPDTGLPDMSTMDSDKSDKLVLDVFLDTVLLDWRNFQPEDNGAVLAYSREAALALFSSEDWADLYNDLAGKAQKASGFRERSLEAQAKNS